MSKIASKLTMDEEVIYCLLVLFAKVTAIIESKVPPSKIINCEDFLPKIAIQVKKAIWDGALTFQTLFHENKQRNKVIQTENIYSSPSLQSCDCISGSQYSICLPHMGFR